ncbi:MAG: polysaccharide biosynthesis/export family protein [Sphingobium sp.]|uniref:polysaccharide biosynthesis/export family protein n=1 Tax=Sphingobium sp. TaxID=1912891 RepID=UPI0029B3B9A8|nr:polysaccharide biosynthesis/export family protein [Sphingobium sp.]MDX3909288.1 polysaccharide biosynthesis/export family protein [Sphingobium sp.]
MNLRFLLCLFASIFLYGCATSAAPVVQNGERYMAQSDAASSVEDYKLGAGDKVRMTVFNEPTLSGEFSVSADGALSLPLLGDVQAVGKAPAEIASLVQKRLADGYIRDPKVSIEVTAYRPFFILGEVKAPGQYPYASGLTVLNAVATAQGFTPRASRKVVYIRRSGATAEETYRLTPDLIIRPGDTIRVGERYF